MAVKRFSPDKDSYFWNNRPFFITVLMLCSLGFSYMILIHFKEGGDVTWFSMLFLYLIGYFFGGLRGIAAAFVFSVLKFFGDLKFGYVDTAHMTAEIFDYLIGYTVIGVGGFFSHPLDLAKREEHEKKYYVGRRTEDRYLVMGFIIAALLRFISSVANFVIFYSRPDLNLWRNIREALLYCLGYVGVETVLTLILISIPWVAKAAQYCKYISTHKYPFDPYNI